MTFFDWPTIGPNGRGVDSIANTLFRVNGRPALDYWVERLNEHNVRHQGIQESAERAILRFQDPGRPLLFSVALLSHLTRYLIRVDHR